MRLSNKKCKSLFCCFFSRLMKFSCFVLSCVLICSVTPVRLPFCPQMLESCSKITIFTSGTVRKTFCLHRYGYGSLPWNTQDGVRAYSWNAQSKGRWKPDWRYCCFSKPVLKNQKHINRNFSPPFFFLFSSENIRVFCAVYKLGFKNRNRTVYFLFRFHTSASLLTSH